MEYGVTKKVAQNGIHPHFHVLFIFFFVSKKNSGIRTLKNRVYFKKKNLA